MMERTEFDRLQNEVAQPAASGEEAQTKLERIRKNLADSVRSGSLQIVNAEEIALIAEFRIWKAGPGAASGVFHYKRKERHK
jgi:hypothetical protein